MKTMKFFGRRGSAFITKYSYNRVARISVMKLLSSQSEQISEEYLPSDIYRRINVADVENALHSLLGNLPGDGKTHLWNSE